MDQPAAATPPEAQAGPERGEARTFRLRIDLDGTSPPVWRRVEVASDLCLDQVHDVVQAAVGWTDSHLHRFADEPELNEPTARYLCPFDVAEGDDGTPEERVRLEEVLGEVGDRLAYQYDYGDNWEHTLWLEAVLPREGGDPRPVCTDGRRPGPPEDCGGVHGYELIVGTRDPDHPAHAECIAEFAALYGDEVDPAMFDLEPFDTGAVNARLEQLDLARRPIPPEASGPLGELVRAVLDPRVRRRLHRLLADAEFDRPVAIDPDAAARMVRPYRWLLERVGADGITLTQAGYLPPSHVKAAVVELGLGEEWIGAGNREHLTFPVWHLRRSARQLGLVRKHRGKLLVTAARPCGRRRSGRVVAPAGRAHAAGLARRRRGTGGAGGAAGDRRPRQRRARGAGRRGARGWRLSDGTPLTASTIRWLLGDDLATLERIGVLASAGWGRGLGTPTGQGVMFAGAALRAWPSSA